MPAIRHAEPWAHGLRTSVRSSTAEGWSVCEFRGKVRLEVRLAGHPKQTTFLPFDWAKGSVGDVLTRVRNIYVLVNEGHSLKGAARIAEGKAPKPVADWAGALERFKVQKLQHGRTLNPETWRRCYLPVLSDVVELMNSSRAPDNPADLLDLVIRKWEPGSRMRQIRAQSLSQVALSVRILDVTLDNDAQIENSFAFRYGNNFIVNQQGQLLANFGSLKPPNSPAGGLPGLYDGSDGSPIVGEAGGGATGHPIHNAPYPCFSPAKCPGEYSSA